MTRLHLARRLAAILALPAMTPALTSCLFGECLPDHVITESVPSVKQLEPEAACDVLQTSGSTNLSPKVCAQHCSSAEPQCRFDMGYVTAVEQANSAADAGGAGSPIVCPTEVGAQLSCFFTTDTLDYNKCTSGRRPAGLAEPVIEGSPLGAFLAMSAHLEAASIVAFRVLHAELEALDAPRDLLDAARAAEADEVRHTAVMTALASRHDALAPAPEITPQRARRVEEIAVENMVEGVVRETFGAAVALFQASHAVDPVLREAMRAIAADECAHAALAFRASDFLDGLLDAAGRAHVAASKRDAMRGLRAALAEPDAIVRRLAGLPSVAEATRILDAMTADLWSASRAA